MPQVPSQGKPPAPADCYIVIGLYEHPTNGVWASAQVWVVAATTEEDAVSKISPISRAEQFIVQYAPVFPRVGPLPPQPPMP